MSEYKSHLTDNQVKELMMLCKDFITNTVKPYNYRWRHDSNFDEVEYEEEADDE